MIKNIVFDLDGVLFDGCDFHAELFICSYNSFSEKKLTKNYHDLHLNGLSTKKKLEVMCIDEVLSLKIYEMKQHLTSSMIDSYIKPDKKVHEICEYLTNNGFKLFCVSNSIKITILKCLMGMGVIDFFTGIISNEDVKEPKPSPEPYLTLFERHSLIIEESLIIEDSPYGLESAYKSGANVLPVLNCEDVTLEKIMRKVNSL